MSDKGFIWNPSNYECECDKSCDIGEYLDYKNCKCRKKTIDKLVEEWSENIDGNKISMQFLHGIYSTICHIFNNKHMHLQCFYLLSLVFKKKNRTYYFIMI